VVNAFNILRGLAQGDQIKDFAHAARLFVDNNYELQPRFSNLFHVVFNLTPQAARIFNNVDKMEINMLVKTIDLPTFNIDLQTHNQYNRQVHSQHKINYNPVSITFHDDQKDLIRNFLQEYTKFFFNDSKYELGAGSYNTDDRYSGYRGDDFGMSDGNQRFFKDIRVYTMMQKRFAEYTLVNPIINAFGHDSHSYANTGVLQHTMQINYEAVKYATGFVNNINPKGFSDIHYDNSPSPLGVFGGGVGNSIFFQGGLVDAANSVANDLAGGNLLGAVIKGGVIFNNTKDVDLSRVLTKDLERVVGSVLRGKNPLSDIILPNIFGGTGQNNTGSPGSGTGSPVDRGHNLPAPQALPNGSKAPSPNRTIRSNGSNVTSSGFGSIVNRKSTPVNIGNATTIPSTSATTSSPARISDFSHQTSSTVNTRSVKLLQLDDRINSIEAQIPDAPDPLKGLLEKEKNNLLFRRALEFGK